MIEPMPDFDPHGLKGKGANSAKHAFADTTVPFAEYPKHIIQDGKTYSVESEGATPVFVSGPIGRITDDDLSGPAPIPVFIVDNPALATVTSVAEVPGSGSERWPNQGWTAAGDGTGYPGDVPTQAQADAVVAEAAAEREQDRIAQE